MKTPDYHNPQNVPESALKPGERFLLREEVATYHRQCVDEQSLKGLKIEYRNEDNRYYVYDKDGGFLWSGEPFFNAWRCALQDRELKQLRERVKALEAERERRPMETAPKDGKEFFIFCTRANIPERWLVAHYMPGGYCVEDHPYIDEGFYFWTGSGFDKVQAPTGWMPIPELLQPAKEAHNP